MTIDSTDIRILTASSIAGKVHPDFLQEYFSNHNKETVKLCIESLVRRRLLRWERDLLCPTDEGLRHTSLSELFGCQGVDTGFTPPSPVTGRDVSAMVNLLISGKQSRSALFPVIKRLALSSGAVCLTDNRYVPDIPVVRKLCRMTNADLALTLTNLSFGKEASLAVRAFANTVSACPTSEAGMLSMLAFHLLLYGSQAPAGGVAELLLTLNTVVNINGTFAANPLLGQKHEKTDSIIECDTDMTIRLSRDCEMPPHLWLYCDIVKTDIVSEWSLSKAGLFRALDAGLTVKDIRKELGTDYYDQILDQWEGTYNRIRVYDSCVVSVTEDLSPVMENLPSLKGHLICKISDGIYLMKRSTSRMWQVILCGVCHLERLPLSVGETTKPLPEIDFTTGEEFTLESLQNKAEERIIADPRSLEVTDQRLKDFFNLGSTVSAAGMDFNGKSAVIRDAVRSGRSYLLIESLDDTICAKPVEIIRTEDKGNLLKLLVLPQRSEVLLPVSSVYRVTSLEAFSSHSSSRSSF